jgi:hypothetical protein
MLRQGGGISIKDEGRSRVEWKGDDEVYVRLYPSKSSVLNIIRRFRIYLWSSKKVQRIWKGEVFFIVVRFVIVAIICAC